MLAMYFKVLTGEQLMGVKINESWQSELLKINFNSFISLSNNEVWSIIYHVKTW